MSSVLNLTMEIVKKKFWRTEGWADLKLATWARNLIQVMSRLITVVLPMHHKNRRKTFYAPLTNGLQYSYFFKVNEQVTTLGVFEQQETLAFEL